MALPEVAEHNVNKQPQGEHPMLTKSIQYMLDAARRLATWLPAVIAIGLAAAAMVMLADVQQAPPEPSAQPQRAEVSQ